MHSRMIKACLFVVFFLFKFSLGWAFPSFPRSRLFPPKKISLLPLKSLAASKNSANPNSLPSKKAQTSFQVLDQPPLDWSIILFQSFSSTIAASVSHLLLQTVLQAIFIKEDSSPETVNAVLWGVSMTTFAIVPWLTALSVSIFSPFIYGYYSSFWWALVGAYIGAGASFAFGTLLFYLDTSPRKNIAIPFQILFNGLFMGLTSVLFFTLFRRPYKDIIQLGSLLQFSKDSIRWGIPIPQYHPQKATLFIPILSGSF